MNYNNTKAVGNATEAIILSEFIKNGIPTLLPFGDNESYDLVIDVEDKFYRVQCKTGNYKNGVITFNARSCNKYTYTNYIGKIEYFAVYCNELNTSYLVPIDKISNIGSVSLRVLFPKNGQIKDVNWAKDFEFKTQLEKLLSKSNVEY